MTPLCYLAHPIDYADGLALQDMVQSYREALLEAGASVYDPRAAFATNPGGDLVSIGLVNGAALYQADRLLAILPLDTFTIGTVVEIDRAVSRGIPTAIVSNSSHGVQMAMWAKFDHCRHFSMDDNPGEVAAWLLGSTHLSRNVLRYVRLHSGAYEPTKAYPGDAGWDLYTSAEAELKVNDFRDIATGIAVEMPQGYYGRISGRSSTWRNYGLHVVEGIIDEGYRGELCIGVRNLSDGVVRIPAGTRLGQLLVHRNNHTDMVEVKELSPSTRGDKGYGSSGK